MLTKEGSKKRRRESYTISFRVDTHHLNQLEKGAAAYGISVHEYARQRLIELLERQDEARVLEEAVATRRSVEALRNDLAATLEVLLTNTMPGTKEEKAARAPMIRDWIKRHLCQDPGDQEG